MESSRIESESAVTQAAGLADAAGVVPKDEHKPEDKDAAAAKAGHDDPA